MPKYTVSIISDPHTDYPKTHEVLVTTDAAAAKPLCDRLHQALRLSTDFVVEMTKSYAQRDLESPKMQNRLVVNLMGAACGDWIIKDKRFEDRGIRSCMFLKPQDHDAKFGLERDKNPLAVLEIEDDLYFWRLTGYGFDWYRDTGCLENAFGTELLNALEDYYKDKTD